MIETAHTAAKQTSGTDVGSARPVLPDAALGEARGMSAARMSDTCGTVLARIGALARRRASLEMAGMAR